MDRFDERLHQELSQFPKETDVPQKLEENVLASLHSQKLDTSHFILKSKSSLSPGLYAIGAVLALSLLILVSVSPISPFKGTSGSDSHSTSQKSASNTSSSSTGSMSGSSTHSSASWAYPFVRVNGQLYGVSTDQNKIVKQAVVGDQIGVVKRDLSDTNIGASHEQDFDSNILNIGTPLYKDKKDDQAIIFKENGQYYKAEKIKS